MDWRDVLFVLGILWGVLAKFLSAYWDDDNYYP